ncbi:glycosyltransferase [Sorangium sp. So ce1097]|uniref:glycosyltransferase n=1 Tax=Sorangium sp. So ce1097 TaxID=3133330 RepID=UPI003F5DDF7D
MSALLHAAACVPLAWALAVASVSAEAIRRAARRRAPGAPLHGALRGGRLHGAPPGALPGAPPGTAPSGEAPPAAAGALRVLVVRPCAGQEPHLERTLRSLAGARLPASASARCVFAVADAGDGALPAASAAAEALRAAAIPAEVALTAAAAPNRKAAQLAAVVARETAPFDVVVVADSDVDLDGVDLDALVGPLRDGARPAPLDAVWAPPVEVAPASSLGDRASAAVLGASLHAFPLLAGLDPRGLVGKLFAVRADALAAAGGFAALTAHLGEDMELSRRLLARRGARGTIAAAPLVAPSLAAGRALRDVIARYARWITVIRAQRPALLASYPALFFATPLIAALAVVAAPAAPVAAAAAAAIAAASRLAVAAYAARMAGRRASLLAAAADACLADLVLGAAFLRALSSRTVVWRSVRFTIDRRGLLREAGA